MKLMALLHLKSQIFFGCLTSFLQIILIVGGWKTYLPSKRFWSLTRHYSSLHQIDVSPLKDRGILKTILSEGNSSLMPSYGDKVTVKLERLDNSGHVITHPDFQSSEDYKFSFEIGQDQDIFNGIHYGVLSMSQGELARLDFSSAYANPSIAQNVSCRVTLLEVKTPLCAPDSHSLDRNFNELTTGSVGGEADNVQAVFKAQLEANGGQNPLAKEIYKGIKGKDKPPTYYDPSKHKLDPRRELDGVGSDHTWSENVDTIDVFVPLPSQIITKSDISVIIKKNEIWVKKAPNEGIEDSEVILFGGPLFGFIKPSGSNWAVEENKGLFMKGLRVVFSLEKAYGHQELWSSVFNRQYLSKSKMR